MGFWSKTFTWWSGATWGTALWTRRFGGEAGRDDVGNVYFQDKKNPRRRWVIYAGDNDGSRVPPDWQMWLRGTIDELPQQALPPVRKFQQKPTPNLTGTMAAFRPDGALGSGRRLRALDSRVSVRLRTAAVIVLPFVVAACGRGGDEQDSSRPVITNAAAPPSVNQPGVTPTC